MVAFSVAILVFGLLVSCAHRGVGAEVSPVATAAASHPPLALGGADCSRTDGYDAIIVGAGLAGLTAAKELRHLGRSVLILEATERIGGRGFVGLVSTGDEVPPVPIDYGGAWVHGVPTNPLTAQVDAMGFERVRSELEVPYYVDGEQAGEEAVALFDEAWEEYEEALSEAAGRIVYEAALSQGLCAAAEEVAVGDLDAEELCARLARDLVDGEVADSLCDDAERVAVGELDPAPYCAAVAAVVEVTSDVAADYLPRAAELAEVVDLVAATAGPLETSTALTSSSAVDAAGFAAGEDDLVDRGLGTFVEAYGEGLPVCLASPVTRVEYGEEGVTVHANGRDYEGGYVLVTVPVGVLRTGAIGFEPPLPAWKRRAIEGLRMGYMQKVIIPFTRDIFGDDPASSWVLYAGDLGPEAERLVGGAEREVMAFVIKPLGANIAIGFYGGEQARRFEAQCAGIENTSGPRSASGCDDPAIDGAVWALSAMYGAEAVRDAIRVDAIHLTRWSLEPYTLGAYSVPVPGDWDQREALGLPVAASEEGALRLFFAGEASSRAIFNGSFAGAYETGLQAAREINAELLALP